MAAGNPWSVFEFHYRRREARGHTRRMRSLVNGLCPRSPPWRVAEFFQTPTGCSFQRRSITGPELLGNLERFRSTARARSDARDRLFEIFVSAKTIRPIDKQFELTCVHSLSPSMARRDYGEHSGARSPAPHSQRQVRWPYRAKAESRRRCRQPREGQKCGRFGCEWKWSFRSPKI